MNTPSDVAILCRQSTRKSKQERSIPKQLYYMKELAHEIGWPWPADPSNFYIAITSGAASKRPDLERLKRDLTSGIRRRVMVYDLSRIARAALMALDVVSALRECKGQLAVCRGRRIFDYAKPGTGVDEDGMSLEILLADATWVGIGRSVREGMLAKAKRGEWPTRAPRGYVRQHPGVLLLDPRAARKVRKCVQTVRRLSFRKAVEVLTRDGIHISKSALHRLLHSPHLPGDLVYRHTMMKWHRATQGSSTPPPAWGEMAPRRQEVQPSEKQVVVPGAFEPILPANQLQDVRLQVARRQCNKNARGLRKGPRLSSPFAGLATCHHCQAAIKSHVVSRTTRAGKRCRHEYLGCETAGCKNRSYPRAKFEESVLAEVEHLLYDERRLDLLIRKTIATWRDRVRDKTRLIDDREESSRQLTGLEKYARDRESEDPDLLIALATTREKLNRVNRELQKFQRLKKLSRHGIAEMTRAIRARALNFRQVWGHLSSYECAVKCRQMFDQITIYTLGKFDFMPRPSDQNPG